MVNVKKYTLEGKETGTIEVSDEFLNAEASSQMVKDYIIALRANARQWTAHTKTRSEVSHTTKKPHPQKGGGRARQGSLAAPQYKGGGRVFGPRTKADQHVKINKREKLAALRFLIGEKLRNNQLTVVDSLSVEAPKTKLISTFLESKNLTEKRVLFVGEGHYGEFEFAGETAKFSLSSDQHDGFILSMRNIPKTEFVLAPNVNGYDLMLAKEVVVTESALKEWHEWLV